MLMNPLNPSENRNPYLAVIIALVLVAGFFGVRYFGARAELAKTQALLATKVFNEKIILFNRTFIEKVLKSNQEVSFEDRLRLENAVRGLNDKDVLAQWNKFISSATETEAQNNVKELLDILSQKMKI